MIRRVDVADDFTVSIDEHLGVAAVIFEISVEIFNSDNVGRYRSRKIFFFSRRFVNQLLDCLSRCSPWQRSDVVRDIF